MLWELICKVGAGLFYLALHVVPAGSFSPPLKAQEETELLLKMKEGDTAAKDKLIEHNLRLVAHIVKKYYITNVEQEDLISIGTIGLIKGISTFRADKNIRLATYAARCIENATLSQMSFWSRKELRIGELLSRRQKICIYCRTPKTVKQGITASQECKTVTFSVQI